MKAFLDEDFLLQSEAARRLYHDYAEKMPIIDYHCHIDPADIANDKRYDTITEVWLGGDHYKWRLIRANGVPESEVTGAVKTAPYTAFLRFAEALPRAVGNPVYHWTYLELKRYFGIETQLNAETANEIYRKCNEKLAQPGMSVRGIIDQSNVRLICTTDDPIDDLAWHEKIKADPSCRVKVLPAFRPDRAFDADKPDYPQYIAQLAHAAGIKIDSFASLCKALDNRIDYFEAHGCRAADHGLVRAQYEPATEAELDAILKKALGGNTPTELECEQLRTALLLWVAKKYSTYGWVMQIHFGCMRDNNTAMFERVGANTGFDAMNGDGQPQKLAPLLDAMNSVGSLPHMVLYSLNPADSEVVAGVAGCFMAEAECPGKIQLGAGWWFNDTKAGIEKQLLDYANNSILGNFVGMLTDSRSFLSYTRHEYFRRILCNFIGNLVENGEYAPDFDTLGVLVQDICYNNTARFFGFDI